MTTINTHGLKMDGLRKASSNTCKWRGYTQVFYDTADGSVWTVDHSDSEHWTEYDNPSIILACNVCKHMTAQQIADAVAAAVEMRKAV